MIDLSPHQFDTVLSILKAHVPDDTVLAFGSRVKWTATEFSDLDLVICGSKAHDFLTLGRLKEALDESDLPIRVDVHDWNSIPDYFKPNIEDSFEVLVQGTSRFPPASNDSGRSLGEVARIVMGQSPPGETVTATGETPLLNGPTDFGPSHPVPTQYTFDGRRFAEKGDLLFCVRGSTTGRMNWADQRYAIGRGVAALRHLRDPALQPLLRAVVTLALPGLLAEATGSTFPNVSRDQLAKLPWPSLSPAMEQRVARIVGALDDRIELNRRMSETLEAMAQALFKSWFVDFDPVRAKTEGRPSGLPPDLDALFPATFEESELGAIPTGWMARRLEEVIDVNPRRNIRRGEVATHVEMAAVPTRGPQVKAWTHRVYTSGSRFKRGDTLFGRITPSLENGKTALVDFLDANEVGWGSTEFIVLRPKPPWPPEFAYILSRENSFRNHAIVTMTGTSGRQRVPAEAVAAYMMATPKDDVVVAFGNLVHASFALATSLGRQSDYLAASRDALLPRLLSGKLPVDRAKGAVESLS